MRLDGDEAQEALADAWERWARRCATLTPAEWTTPTRCSGWDVRALLAHVCPEPAMFDTLNDAVVDGPAAVTDAAELLRRFNEPDGIAHTTADNLAAQAISDADALTPDTAATRFTDCARILRDTPISHETVIGYPAVGSTTLAVIAEVALMEATVHMLDLADAVGGVEPSVTALTATRDLLIAVPDATAAVEVLAGRKPPEKAVPAIR
ncbi:MAG TPA: maleylpyruvate isomerase N-terminal domain-containing protein [Mycobacterium sp.]|nr:maleylpyruvate isomerase N-terminal domain-containing protein [Mycobacterium sp.]